MYIYIYICMYLKTNARPIPTGPRQGPEPHRARSPQGPTSAQWKAQGRAQDGPGWPRVQERAQGVTQFRWVNG